jgi:predicted nucleic acid-binding protein
MNLVRYLVDASAITWMAEPDVAEALAPLIESGLVGTCGVTDLQLWASIAAPRGLASLAAVHAASFARVETTDADLRRAAAVQLILADQGYRLADWTPLVVAAVGERHGLTVLHHDTSFDLIAKVTGQNVQWAVAEGKM